MLVGLKFIPLTGIPQLAAYLVAYLVIGYDISERKPARASSTAGPLTKTS